MLADEYLHNWLEAMKDKLTWRPIPVSLIQEAKTMMATYPREDLPDWVEALANGDPEHIEDTVDEVVRHMKAEEMQ